MQEECRSFINEIIMQDVGDGHLYDIRFNFIIGDFGIFEGRGWNAVPDTADNQLYIGFIIMDNEEERNVYTAIPLLIENGIRLGKLDKNFEDSELVTNNCSFDDGLIA